jgi:hypothetical protein
MIDQVYPATLIARFWARVNKAGPVVRPELGPCWVWTGSRLHGGYGHMKGVRRRELLAHRASWTIANGPVLNGLWVLHKCDNPPCVRPDHLFLGTPQDNVRDCQEKGRTVLKKGQAPPWKTGAARGSNAPHANFTEQVVEEIIQRYRAGGVSQRELAREFGVHQTTMHRLLSGKNWKHVHEAQP